MIAGTFSEYGRRYVVVLDYRERSEAGRVTVTHGTAPAEAVSVAIMGEVWPATRDGRKDRRYADCVAAGQVVDDLRKIGTPSANRIAALWDRWHLNGMRANCAHMPTDRYMSGMTCAETGYQSGASWLYEPIPADVLAELRTIFGRAE